MPSNPSDLRATGDAMQSTLSRVLEHFDKVLAWVDPDSVPYEVRMAVLEGHDAIEEWTALRRQDAIGGSESVRRAGEALDRMLAEERANENR